MTYMVDGRQYIAVMAGNGNSGRGGAGRAGAPVEPTAAAAQGRNNVSVDPATVVANNNPKLFVYALLN
jgi:hypothetical protein